MNYISTRGNTPKMSFSDVLLMGLAPDGGLMLPEDYPKFHVKHWINGEHWITDSLLLRLCNCLRPIFLKMI